MLQLKDLRQWTVGEKVTVKDGRILKKLEGLPGGRAWVRRAPSFARAAAGHAEESVLT